MPPWPGESAGAYQTAAGRGDDRTGRGRGDDQGVRRTPMAGAPGLRRAGGDTGSPHDPRPGEPPRYSPGRRNLVVCSRVPEGTDHAGETWAGSRGSTHASTAGAAAVDPGRRWRGDRVPRGVSL